MVSKSSESGNILVLFFFVSFLVYHNLLMIFFSFHEKKNKPFHLPNTGAFEATTSDENVASVSDWNNPTSSSP